MKDDEREAYVEVLTKSCLDHLWEPRTDERLSQLILSSGMLPRAKEVLEGKRWWEANKDRYIKRRADETIVIVEGTGVPGTGGGRPLR